MTADRSPSRRTPALPQGLTRAHVVWASLAVGLTLVVGLLSLTVGPPIRSGDVSLAAIATTGQSDDWTDRLFGFHEGVERRGFTRIVVHHSGSAAGSAASISREHEARGIKGLGYHFVIGNGRGAADGEIQAGFRWTRQLPGAHVQGPDSRLLNETSIGVCLVGDGDRRAFTADQVASLLSLVRALQEYYGIDDDSVVLHRDVAPTASPGRLFPELQFRDRLLDVD